jgi:acyl carrier protein
VTTTRDDIAPRVSAIVADALDVPLAEVTPTASLIDDLGAESIDFLDILFRVESAFSIKIPEQDMWRGSIDASTPESIADGVARLRARMPSYAWERLPSMLQPQDLPRLITVRTIVDYLEARLSSQDERNAS